MAKFTSIWMRALRGPTPSKAVRRVQIGLLTLEDRLVPATITWVSPAGGDWSTPGNWDLIRVPAAGDDVVIPDVGAAGADQTILLGTGSVTVQSVTCAEHLTITTAALELAGGTRTLAVAGNTLLSNATLRDATLAAGTFLSATNDGPGALLDGVTIAVGATARAGTDAARGTLLVANELTVDGTLQIGDEAGTDSSFVTLANAMTVGGHGTIRFGWNGGNALGTSVQGPILFTFGPDLTIRAKAGQITGEGSGASNPTYQIQGPVVIEAGGTGLAITSGVGTLETSGAITVAPNTALAVTPRAWTNAGTVSIDANSVFTTGGAWTNIGTIALANATTNLGGTFTQFGMGSAAPQPGQGMFTRAGGTVALTGTITGGLTLDSATGPWTLREGVVSGGTIATSGANILTAVGAGPGGLLTGVTIAANSTVLAATGGGRLRIANGLTVDGTLQIGDDAGTTPAGVTLTNPMTVGGHGTIRFGGLSNDELGTSVQGPILFTFGPDLTIRAKAGQITGEGSGASNPTYQIQGPVVVEAGGTGLAITGGVGTLETSGAITVPAGATLTIAARTYTNDGMLTATGLATIAAGTSWTNSGTVAATGGVVNTSIPPTNLAGGTLTGGTWEVTDSGTLRLPGPVTANAATIVLDGGGSNIYAGGTGTTDALGGLTTNAAAGSITVQNGHALTTAAVLVDDGTLTVGAGSTVTATGGLTVTGTLVGSGTVNSNLTNAGIVAPDGAGPGTLTITGDYTQTSGGKLAIDIAGPATFDRLTVAGSANLDGTLTVALANGFGPAAGQTYTPITFASRTADFANFYSPNYAGSPVFAAAAGATVVTLTALITAPDLKPTSLPTPGPWTEGMSVQVPFTVHNSSAVVAHGPWVDRLYLSPDPVLDATDVSLGEVPHTADVPADQSYNAALSTTVPAVAAGRYYLIVHADADVGTLDQTPADNIRSSAAAFAINLDEQPLALDMATIGRIETPNSVDRWTFAGAAGQTVNLVALNAAGVQFALRGPNGFVAFAGLTGNSDIVILPTTGTYVLEATSAAGATGAYSFRVNRTNATALTLRTPITGTLAGSGSALLYKLDVTQPGPLVVHLAGEHAGDRIGVFVKLGAVPTRAVNDYHNPAAGSIHQIDVPLAASGTLFVLVYGESLAAPSDFTLEIDSTAVAVSAVSPNTVGDNLPTATTTITGLGFLPGTTVALVPALGDAVPAVSVSIDQSTRLTATFDLTTVVQGDYAVRVTLPGGATNALPAAFHVVAGGEGKLETKIILPAALGRHAPATIFVEYANVGTAAIEAPILVLQSADPNGSDRPLLTLDQNLMGQGLWTSAQPAGFDNSVQIYASGAQPGLLLPGERIRVPVYYAGLQQPWDFSDTATEFVVGVHDADDDGTIDWASDTFARPDWIAADVWAAVKTNLHLAIGDTWGGYVDMLSRNAGYLYRFGQRVTDVGELYGFEVQQAVGRDMVGTLASAVDAAAPAPGLALNFGRSFGNTLTSRRHDGPFGRGWDASWQFSLEKRADGTLIVHESADSERRFQPDSRHTGTYFSQTGDPGVMKADGTGYKLTETNGLVTRYRADGTLDYMQDINANRITAAYSAGRLVTLTHSGGAVLTISYTPENLIGAISDSVGHTTTFTYDTVNRLLLSATGPAGTTRYAYSVGKGTAREYALTAVTGPDGLTQHFEYDLRGRLTASYLDGNIGRADYDYERTGVVKTTDAAGVTSTAFFDAQGLVVRVEDSLGHYVVNEYNDARQLIKSTDDLGRVTSYTRCDCGRPKTITDVYGHTQLTFTLGGPNNEPTAFTDANGNVTRYTYDAVGNVTAVTYEDGTAEHATYDAAGNLDVTTNRRGATIDRTVNAAGQVTHEAWSDGTIRDYVYDARGRLHTATDSAQGTTTLDYDMADRLTNITYPNGRWLSYSYDAAGRRTQIKDQTGFETNYTYDAAGRLKELTDKDDQRVVLYTYDAAGRLGHEDKGNGTYTVYAYDTAGRETSIFNYAPDGLVNSKFVYTFDAAGRRDTQTTIDGAWTYGYDLTDQLTHAVFASTNPNIPDQDLNYEYDALGNRTRTVLNGVTTDYAANGMNQYTSAGATTFHYDADGNLIQENGPDGLKQYTYDLQNRLVRVQTPAGIWDYEYDVLGNRTAVVKDGVRTEYLIDPTGLRDVAEYDGTGAATAGYAYGFGLVDKSDAAGAGYFDFDGLGSTAGLSRATGAYSNRYTYDPFGRTMAVAEAEGNAVGFIGREGVLADGSGQLFMHARFYSPVLGRFTSQDPIRLSGGVNGYAYTANDPVNLIDPVGRVPEPGIDYDKSVCPDSVACYEYDTNTMHLNENGDAAFRECVFRHEYQHYLNIDAGLNCEQNEVSAFRVSAACGGQFGSADAYNRSQWRIDDIETGEGYRSCGTKKDPRPIPQPPPLPPACFPKPNQSTDPDQKRSSSRTLGPVTGAEAGDHDKDCGGSGGGTGTANAFDPNELLGAAGYGPQAYIAADTLIPYHISFENLATASAPAQRVDITDPLSSNLDWDTLSFTELGFGDTIVPVTNGGTYFFTTLVMTFNDQFFNVEVELRFDRDAGVVHASFQSVDPQTKLPPDVLTGFLPPEDGTGRGQGHIGFTIKPKASTPTDTAIRNVADIRFDYQQVIATNQIDPTDPSQGTDPAKEALNTIDADAPTVTFTQPPASVERRQIRLSWSGTDVGGGIAGFDVFVATDGGPALFWKEKTTDTSGTFLGRAGHHYSFQVIAYDHVGQKALSPEYAVMVSSAAPAGLPTVPEDSKAGKGFTIKQLLSGGFTDVDGTKSQGVAVTGLTGTGTWQYSLNGRTWKTVGDVNTTKALLLTDAQRLRFVPAADWVGTGKVSFKAWDRSHGVGGTRADTTGTDTAFSLVEVTDTIAVTPVNDRPVLDANHVVSLPAMDVGATDPIGSTVSGIVAGATDVDSTHLGMAITGMSGTGAWQYRLTGAGQWTAISKAKTTSALLLDAATEVRFVPATDFVGTAILSFRAWDGSTGTAVGKANSRAGTAFSTATAMAYASVGNNAPTLDSTIANVFPDQLEDGPAPATTVAFLLGSSVTDIDVKAKKGIAVVAATGSGSWQFSRNGRRWFDVGTTSAEAALLLADTARLRFVPNADWNGTAIITYRAWDQTIGETGARVDVSVGNQHALSGNVAVATLAVTSVNDAPTLATANSPLLPALVGTETNPTSTPVSALLGTVVDSDSATIGIAVTSRTGAGTWQWSADGLAWVALSMPPANGAFLLDLTAFVRYLPASTARETAALTFRAWDGSTGTAGQPMTTIATTAFSVQSETVAVTVANSAPVLDSLVAHALTTIAEDTVTSGDTVKSLVQTGITDADLNTAVGIAVTGTDGTGQWQYSFNGKVWTNVGTVVAASALLLRPTDRLRFVPATNWTGTAHLTFHAWDQSVGVAGERADVTQVGATSFSSADGTATLVVAPLNDRPVLDASFASTLPPVDRNDPDPAGIDIAMLVAGRVVDPDGTSAGIAVTGLTGKGTWQLSTDGTNWTPIDRVPATKALLLAPGVQVRFVPGTGFIGAASLRYRAWDMSSGTAGNTIAVSKSDAVSTAEATLFATVDNHRPQL